MSRKVYKLIEIRKSHYDKSKDYQNLLDGVWEPPDGWSVVSHTSDVYTIYIMLEAEVFPVPLTPYR